MKIGKILVMYTMVASSVFGVGCSDNNDNDAAVNDSETESSADGDTDTDTDTDTDVDTDTDTDNDTDIDADTDSDIDGDTDTDTDSDSDTDGDTETAEECPVGTESCPCTLGGACNSDLVCVNDICMDVSSDGDADGDSDGDTDTDTDADSDGDTDTDTDTDSGGDCSVGMEGCSCTQGGTCNPGLVCLSDICVQGSDGDTDADTDSDISTDSETECDCENITIGLDPCFAPNSCACFCSQQNLDTESDFNSDTGADTMVDTLSADSWVNINDVTVTGSEGSYTFNVTFESTDIDCTQYADWWEVVTESGSLVFRRILQHPHTPAISGNPVMRSGSPVDVTATETLIVRGHMNNAGYIGIPMRGSVDSGFVSAPDIDESFAPEVESEGEQPGDCIPE